MFGICSCKLPVTLVQIFPVGSEMRQCSVMLHHGHFDGDSSQVLAYLFSMSCCAISLHVAYDDSWEHLVRNPMISGMNTSLRMQLLCLASGTCS